MGDYLYCRISTQILRRKIIQDISIILADDNDIFRELIFSALSTDDRKITSCQDGKEALDWVQKRPFDLLITDLKMPEIEGIELLKAAKDLHPEILVIIVTGFGSLETAVEAIRLGAYDYLQKPFKIEEIQLVVKNACERIKLQRQNRLLWEQLSSAYEQLALLKKKDSDEETMEEQQIMSSSGRKVALGDFYYPSPHLGPYVNEFPTRPQLLQQLERLANLSKEGLLSEQEFATCKKTVMGLLERL